MNNEERLFYACTGYCEAFFRFLYEQNKHYHCGRFDLCDDYEFEQIMEFHKKHLRNKFSILKELVNEIDEGD